LRQLSVSPDARHAVCPTASRGFTARHPTGSGWVNTSALTLIDLQKLEVLNTVLLDDVDRGAAPWASGLVC